MAKAKSSPKKAPAAEPREVVIDYDLFDLPTAFHKAGLAGMILLIESLKVRKSEFAPLVNYELTDTTARFTFREAMLIELMNDLYFARVEEVRVKGKWQGAESKREEFEDKEEDGKAIRIRYYVYDQVQPKGLFFDNVFEGDKEVWRKLWRDMFWNIVRGRPKTRIPFNNCAAGKSSGEGEAAWEELLKVEKAKGKGDFYVSELSSALFPGAQTANAEDIPFRGRAEQNLLLHFWVLTSLIYVPRKIEVDGESDFAGYTLAVPEVSDLEKFIADYPKLLESLEARILAYRPAQAVIDLAAEGALAFFDHLATITSLKLETGSLRFSVRAIEYLHMEKAGNNIKTMATGRISPNPRLLSGYRTLVSPSSIEPRYRNPLFRRGLIVALLEGREWYEPMGKMLTTYNAELFLRRQRRDEDDENGYPHFAIDVARKFKHLSEIYGKTLERYRSMNEAERGTQPPSSAPEIINRVVRSYLYTRTEDKTGIKLKDYETDSGTDWKSVPSEFNDAKQKLALGLMLEFRSRKEQAFVDHFAATFFSVTQRINEPDRLELSGYLITPEKLDALKTLTLLALSANS
jgi:CRISPR-associated protein Cmx8